MVLVRESCFSSVTELLHGQVTKLRKTRVRKCVPQAPAVRNPRLCHNMRAPMSATTSTSTYAQPHWQAILDAHARIQPRIHRRYLTLPSSDGMAGARLFFKCENFQNGSFKIRAQQCDSFVSEQKPLRAL